MPVLHSNIKGYGKASGKAFVARRMPDCSNPAHGSGVSGLREALDTVIRELERQSKDDEIFAAHLEMACDPMLEETISAHITEGEDILTAIGNGCGDICSMFSEIDDEYLRARTDDVRDICSRISAVVKGEDRAAAFERMEEGSIVIAEDLAPSDTAAMDLNKVCGIVTEKGSRTSHVCIIAQGHGIPVLTGVKDATKTIIDGDFIALDAGKGIVHINPGKDFMEQFNHCSTEDADCLGQVTETDQNTMPEVLCNAGSISEIQKAIKAGAAGIGLLRTEFVFIDCDVCPDENKQYEIYKAAAQACEGRPLTIRTMDVGGDKKLPFISMEQEDNPFLGLRGIRLSLAHREIFKVQLRAILRASAASKIRLMFPMVSTVNELTEALDILEECKSELKVAGFDLDEAVETGIMIETPAAVFIADELACHADFFSIGTNDLAQYVMAADRGNASVAYLCDTSQSAVRAAIEAAIQAAHRHGIPVGMCGAMASDPTESQWLKSKGLDFLSVAPPLIDQIKAKITDPQT